MNLSTKISLIEKDILFIKSGMEEIRSSLDSLDSKIDKLDGFKNKVYGALFISNILLIVFLKFLSE